MRGPVKAAMGEPLSDANGFRKDVIPAEILCRDTTGSTVSARELEVPARSYSVIQWAA
jgi:hypothetical protein